MPARKTANQRRGVTSVEMAIVSPLLFTVIFASIEFSRACMLRHTAEIAAAEGARAGIVSGATASDCRSRALAELVLIGVKGASASVTPAAIDNTVKEVTVNVSVPVAKNGYIFPRFFFGKSIQTSVTLQREVAASR